MSQPAWVRKCIIGGLIEMEKERLAKTTSRSARYQTHYQYLVSMPTYDRFRFWLQDHDINPKDALYIPQDERTRYRHIEGRGGYQKEQLIGEFSEREIERLTR